MENFELIGGIKPFFITKTIYVDLPQFIYSDTKKRIEIGDQATWILKKIPKQKLLNGGVCEQQLMLVNWEEINSI